MKQYIFVLLFLNLSFSCLAQGDFREGYIILNNNDSVSGFIDYRIDKISQRTCFFKQSLKTKKIRYSPEQLKAYGFIEGKRYVSKDLNQAEGKVFIRHLAEGNISLYKYNSVFYVERDTLIRLPQKNRGDIVRKENGVFFKNDYRFIGLLNILMKDCLLNAKEIDYSDRDLTNVVQNYNLCKGHSIKYLDKRPWTQLEYQLYSGLDFTLLYVDELNRNAFDISRSPILGFDLLISSPRIFDRMSLNFGFVYKKSIFQGYSEESSSYTVRNDHIISANFYKLTWAGKYNFRYAGNTPYVKIGVGKYFNIKPFYKILAETDLGNVVRTESYTLERPYRNPIAFWGSIGYTKSVVGKVKTFAECRYEQSNGFIGPHIHPASSTTSFVLIIGLQF